LQTRPLTTTGDNQLPRFSKDVTIVSYVKRTSSGTKMGYVNLLTKQSVLFPLGWTPQSIDW
jgi:hypothetical protein